jgi:signal transduction histidine kinase
LISVRFCVKVSCSPHGIYAVPTFLQNNSGRSEQPNFSVCAILTLLLLTYMPSYAEEEKLDDAQEMLSVLVIYSFHNDLPWQKNFRQGLLSGFESDGRIKYYEESLDSSRFPGQRNTEVFAAYLQDKYRTRRIDLILAESEPASKLFIGNDIFKGILHLMVNPAEWANRDPNQIVLAIQDDIIASYEAMQRIRKSNEVYIIGETFTPYMKENIELLKGDSQGVSGIEVHYLINLEMSDLLSQVSEIPATANIFYLPLFQDGTGVIFTPKDVAKNIARISDAPIFTHYDSLLGSGVVGGLVNSSILAGEATVQKIREVWRAPGNKVTEAVVHQHIYDQRALDRFRIEASNLPASRLIINQSRSIWTDYRNYVITAGMAIVMLMILAVVLYLAYGHVALSRRRLDATRRKLERAQSIAHIGSWEWVVADADGEWSDESCRIFGSRPGAKLLNETMFDIIDPSEKSGVVQAFLDCARAGAPIDLELGITRPDGDKRIVHLRGTKASVDVNDTRVEGTVHDVTETRYLQNSFFTNQRLKSVGQFAGGMAHHFNNMFSVTLGNAEMLYEKVSDDDQRAYLRNVIKSTQAAARMNKQLLTFSKHHYSSVVDTDLTEKVAELKREIQLIVGTDIEVEVKVCVGLWTIPLNFEEFLASLINVVNNAVDAMSAKGKLIIGLKNVILDEEFIKSNAGSRVGEYVCVSVLDSGSGMSKEVLESAFDPFFTTKEVGVGSGLGLSVVYGFVHQLRGYAQLESQVGESTTLNMYFPRSSLHVPENVPRLR